jgi:hypothetical protein
MSKPAPIIFILGPSGVGKTTLGNALADHLGMVHILFDGADGGDGVDVANLRSEWKSLLAAKDPRPLAEEVRRRIKTSGHSGVVISCPSGIMPAEDRKALPWYFSRSPLAKLEECGVRCVTLIGPLVACQEAAMNRANGRVVTTSTWLLNNANWHNFQPGLFPDLVQDAFTDDGSRRDSRDLMREIQERFLT